MSLLSPDASDRRGRSILWQAAPCLIVREWSAKVYATWPGGTFCGSLHPPETFLSSLGSCSGPTSSSPAWIWYVNVIILADNTTVVCLINRHLSHRCTCSKVALFASLCISTEPWHAALKTWPVSGSIQGLHYITEIIQNPRPCVKGPLIGTNGQC